jgi:hypothetical protein
MSDTLSETIDTNLFESTNLTAGTKENPGLQMAGLACPAAWILI